jgi:hypothetical protein
MAFFKKITSEEWDKLKKEAEEYDKKDSGHVSAQETSLTGETLRKIAKAKKELNNTTGKDNP